MKVRSFYEIESFDFPQLLSTEIFNEINSKTKEYILRVDEEEFKNYLIEMYTIEPLEIFFDKETIGMPSIRKGLVQSERGGGRRFIAEFYNFTISYPFQGSSILFKVQPQQFYMTSLDINVDENTNVVSFSFDIEGQNAEVFKRKKEECFRMAFSNYDKTNRIAREWNPALRGLITHMFDVQKNKYLKENDFFEAINVQVNKETEGIFSVPSIPKKIIQQPLLPNREFSTEPIMSRESYLEILKTIYQAGKAMERKPSLYQGKDEEGLRDQFLFLLEGRYEATTATGETFNRGGKVDILLKYAPDGSNLFIAECKVWHGSEEFLSAISQLFDRYLTWRDSKAALIFFVKNKDFSKVLATIKIDVGKHPYFKRTVNDRVESSFSYLFSLPQDTEKDVYLEIMAFHFDK